MLQRNSKLLRMGLTALVGIAGAQWALAGGFFLTIGSPVAANVPQVKGAVLVVRPDGCEEPAKAQITGTAEGIVNGARRSVPLKLATLPTPGVYAVNREWPSEGVWVVSLTGNYRGLTTSAIVPIGPKGFMRESSKFFPRAASEGEIEASLKSLTGGAK
ncbi:MAG: hypothetical protein JWO48_3368 [Bryobacterales bacterium]|nr:hypothetical protein [Bryobacterales bacterium]